MVKEYIPGTEERRDRLFGEILAKKCGSYDGLAFVEWEDGSKTIEPVRWDSDNSAIVDEKGNRWFARGLGAEPKEIAGVPVWDVFAGNAGIISTEASLIADAERHQDNVYDVEDGEQLPDDVIEEGIEDPNQGKTPADVMDSPQSPQTPAEANASAGDVATDGGVEADAEGAVYDLRPPKDPKTGERYDGVAISVRDPDYFDPNPVTRSDAKAAVEWAERAGDVGRDDRLIWLGIGAGLVIVMWAVMTILPWLLSQIGGAIGGSGGGGGGQSISFLALLAAPGGVSALKETVKRTVKEAIPGGA